MSESATHPSDTQKSYESILTDQIDEALSEFERPTEGLFLSALSAGLDLGFGPLLVAITVTLTAGTSEALNAFLTANAYTVGFIFVVLGRVELFTEHSTLAVLPVLDRTASIRDLGRLWGIVFVGNLVGGAVFALFIVFIGPEFGLIEVSSLNEITKPYLEPGVLGLFGGALLAGWLMGLLSWLAGAARDTIGLIVVIYLTTFVIGFGHLPHCIAGSIEILAALFGTSSVSVFEYGEFLLVSTIGNTIGGTFFVGLLKYGHVVRGGPRQTDVQDTP